MSGKEKFLVWISRGLPSPARQYLLMANDDARDYVQKTGGTAVRIKHRVHVGLIYINFTLFLGCIIHQPWFHFANTMDKLYRLHFIYASLFFTTTALISVCFIWGMYKIHSTLILMSFTIVLFSTLFLVF